MEILIIVAALIVYILPSVIAGCRKHHNLASLCIVNIAFGWTFIGWIGSLAWSFSNKK